EDGHLTSGLGEHGRGGRAARAGPDDQDLGVDHAAPFATEAGTAPASSCSAKITRPFSRRTYWRTGHSGLASNDASSAASSTRRTFAHTPRPMVSAATPRRRNSGMSLSVASTQ